MCIYQVDVELLNEFLVSVGFPPTWLSVPENRVEKEVPADIVGGAIKNAVKKSTKTDAKNMKT